MKRGYTKQAEGYFSLVLIPPARQRTRNLRMQASTLKLFTAGLAAVTFIAALSIVGIIRQNAKLKDNLASLTNLNTFQKNIISQNSLEIDVLRKNSEKSKKDVSNFIEQCSQLTDRYIKNTLYGSKTSRSGINTDRAFSDMVTELKDILGDLEENRSLDEEALKRMSEADERLRCYISALPTLWPVRGNITSGFGTRLHPLRLGKTFHDGIDIAADYGTDIKASADGKVVFTGWRGAYGSALIIDHGMGMSSLYGHTSKILVKEGQEVKKGQIIARVGNSGTSTGAHLHLRISINNEPIDPMNYLLAE